MTTGLPSAASAVDREPGVARGLGVILAAPGDDEAGAPDDPNGRDERTSDMHISAINITD
jgi:hypothetical protein